MNRKSLVLDSNLLLLFVVGSWRKSYIARHKRLRAYSEDDYLLLVELLRGTRELVVTPNTLTETSNFLAHIEEPARSELFRYFANLIRRCSETYVRSNAAVDSHVFVRLGLTDAVLNEVLSGDACLLTSDLNLYLVAIKAGRSAFNFTHLRQAKGTI